MVCRGGSMSVRGSGGDDGGRGGLEVNEGVESEIPRTVDVHSWDLCYTRFAAVWLGRTGESQGDLRTNIHRVDG